MTIEPAAEEHQHRSARERQRRGPMWGCLKWMGCSTIGFFVLIALVVGIGWWYLGSSSFAGLVQLRIEKTLESRLGRNVDIGSVQIERGRQSRIIINGLRVTNSPGAVHPYFATAKQVIVTGGIDSFWGRKIRVGRVDLVEPHLWFEVYPAGAKLTHNFPHWNSGPKSRYEIYHLDLGDLFVQHGAFELLDRRHTITAVANDITSTIHVLSTEDLYTGVLSSPQFALNIQDYVPIRAALRTQFRFTPDNLALQSVALEGGNDLRIYANGKVAPLSEGAYDLHLTSQIGLNRIREIFKVNKVLDGIIDIDGTLKGKGGTLTLAAGWLSPKISADVYDLTNVHGTMNITGDRADIDIQRASYAGGTVAGKYALPQYSEPYAMSIELRYNRIALEKLLNDLGIKDTGFRSVATGTLNHYWEKDRVLAGIGDGTATLAKNATAFSHATYPIPLGGSVDFKIENGYINFKRAALVTDASTINFDVPGLFRI